MNIGIVTIYDGNNMGSFLQAVALQYILEKMGHNVFFIQRMTEEENLRMFVNRSFSRPRPFPLNYLATAKRFLINRKEDKKKREEIGKIYRILQQERQKLPIINVERTEEMDLLICGSDEIWNFNNTSVSVPFYACKEYGKSIKKIAYAVSVGTSTVKDFINNPCIIEAISKFAAIYPRDKSTKLVMDALLPKDHVMVCDPTLLVNKDFFKKDNNRVINERYIMVYAYELNKRELRYIKHFAKKEKLKIISVLHYCPIADSIITESPYNFANIISYAEYCYTSTFHGTIFCTLFSDNFVYRSRRPKVMEVAEYLQITDREWVEGDYEKFEKLIKSKADRMKIDTRLNQIRNKDLCILKDIIEY